MSALLRRFTALLAAGCTIVAASGLAATPADAKTHRATIYLHTTQKRLVAGAKTIRPGVVQIHDSGRRPIVILGKKTAGVDKLAKDLAKANLSVFSDFAVRGVLQPHHSMFLRLRRGTLFTFDAMRKHFPVNAFHVVTVAGKTVNASLPKSRTITMTGHNMLKVPASVPRHTLFHVINHSKHTTYIALFRIGPKTPFEDIKAAAANPTEKNLNKLDVVGIVDIAYLGARQAMWTRLNSPKSNGLVFAFSITGKQAETFHKGTLGAIHFA